MEIDRKFTQDQTIDTTQLPKGPPEYALEDLLVRPQLGCGVHSAVSIGAVLPRNRPLLVGALILTTLAGCATTEETRVCDLIGTVTGISIDIAAAIAERVETADMTVCWDGSCQTPPVFLMPSSRTVDDGCTGNGPDGVCMAHAEATGGKTGFANVPDLPPRPVEVTVTLTDSTGTRIVDQTLILDPKMAEPPPGACRGGGSPYGRITVDADGKARSIG
ncbi:hypothetical protein ACNAW0_06385 [Micromonospora sp. SL1-18]|uniref:hypothetical protein n=1 Tax=Micromonospora sp. SL1-18 TaxID=3399128 RepID=UPI003A4D3EC9